MFKWIQGLELEYPLDVCIGTCPGTQSFEIHHPILICCSTSYKLSDLIPSVSFSASLGVAELNFNIPHRCALEVTNKVIALSCFSHFCPKMNDSHENIMIFSRENNLYCLRSDAESCLFGRVARNLCLAGTQQSQSARTGTNSCSEPIHTAVLTTRDPGSE